MQLRKWQKEIQFWLRQEVKKGQNSSVGFVRKLLPSREVYIQGGSHLASHGLSELHCSRLLFNSQSKCTECF